MKKLEGQCSLASKRIVIPAEEGLEEGLTACVAESVVEMLLVFRSVNLAMELMTVRIIVMRARIVTSIKVLPLFIICGIFGLILVFVLSLISD